MGEMAAETGRMHGDGVQEGSMEECRSVGG